MWWSMTANMPSWDTPTRQDDRHAEEEAETSRIGRGCEAGGSLDANQADGGNDFLANVYLRGGFKAIASVAQDSPAGRRLSSAATSH